MERKSKTSFTEKTLRKGRKMTARDFCYWMQGFFEISESAKTKTEDIAITPEQAKIIKNHLAMVFQHEIDPSFGGPEKQAALNHLHKQNKPDGTDGQETKYRC